MRATSHLTQGTAQSGYLFPLAATTASTMVGPTFRPVRPTLRQKLLSAHKGQRVIHDALVFVAGMAVMVLLEGFCLWWYGGGQQ